MSDIVPQASPFDQIRKFKPDGTEFWSARDLMPLLGYLKWQQFEEAIERAQAGCQNSGQDAQKHFLEIIFKPARGRPGRDLHLTRYAAYMVALNSDPRKPEVGMAQTYFVVKTHEAERNSKNRVLDFASDASKSHNPLHPDNLLTPKPLVEFKDSLIPVMHAANLMEKGEFKEAAQHMLNEGWKTVYVALREMRMARYYAVTPETPSLGLYVCHSAKKNIVKIGVSRNPNKRLEGLKRQGKLLKINDLKLIDFIMVPFDVAMLVESEYKKFYSSQACLGTEWFKFSDQDELKSVLTGLTQSALDAWSEYLAKYDPADIFRFSYNLPMQLGFTSDWAMIADRMMMTLVNWQKICHHAISLQVTSMKEAQ